MRYEKDEIEERIEKKNKKEKRLIVLIYICVSPIIVLYLLYLVQMIFEPDVDFNVFGIQQYTIISNSMKPTMQIDDLIFIKKYPESEINVQDIITFESNSGEIITHRVVKKEQKRDKTVFITKGDSNNSEDPGYVTYEQIKGKYIFKIAKIGKIVVNLKRTDTFLIILIILATLYLRERRMNIKRIKRHNERIEYEKENK